MSASAEAVTKTVFDLYRAHGEANYIGEKVTQTEHAIQCAILAEEEGFPVEVRFSFPFYYIVTSCNDYTSQSNLYKNYRIHTES